MSPRNAPPTQAPLAHAPGSVDRGQAPQPHATLSTVPEHTFPTSIVDAMARNCVASAVVARREGFKVGASG